MPSLSIGTHDALAFDEGWSLRPDHEIFNPNNGTTSQYKKDISSKNLQGGQQKISRVFISAMAKCECYIRRGVLTQSKEHILENAAQCYPPTVLSNSVRSCLILATPLLHFVVLTDTRT